MTARAELPGRGRSGGFRAGPPAPAVRGAGLVMSWVVSSFLG